MGWLNRYTIGGLVTLLVLGVLWMSFGGAISSWSADVYSALKGNRQAEDQLKQAQQSLSDAKKQSDQVNSEYQRAQAAMQVLVTQIADAKRQAEAAAALAQQKGQLANQLQTRVVQLESQRQALPKATTVHEAYNAIQKLGPPYSR